MILGAAAIVVTAIALAAAIIPAARAARTAPSDVMRSE
jgi:ABC-type lipoprotein release transport system permease subunit